MVNGPSKYTCGKSHGAHGSFTSLAWRVPHSLKTTMTLEAASIHLCLYLVHVLCIACLLVVQQQFEVKAT